MDELVKPNWHAAVVHFPIALLMLGAGIELLSFAGWRRSSLRTAGRWMMVFGALTGVPSAFVGIHALADVLPAGGLAELRQSDPLGADRVWYHVAVQSVSTALSIIIVATWLALSDHWRDRLSIVFKLGLASIIGLTLAGAWLGGEMVYSHKVGPGYFPVEEPLLPNQKASEFPTSLSDQPIEKTLADALVPEQVHLWTAGLAMAMATIGLGLSMRRVTQNEDPAATEEARSVERIVRAFGTEPGGRIDPHSAPRERVSVNHTPPLRAGGLWFLTLILMTLTAIGGLWVTAHEADAWSFSDMRSAITEPMSNGDPGAPPRITRRLAHLVTGVVIVADTLVLALLSLALPRKGWLLIIFAVPLVLAMAIQIWLGVLLVLEGPGGLITRFAPI
ncbi:MAG TPA: DUF2231 domain-containing protein [Tepidisphaeraceae bacterium]